MPAILSITALSKSCKSGLKALDDVDLSIERGEIFALLGPNGAGKTTLISIVCRTVTKTSGMITVDGHDIAKDFRAARKRIGLVPQEVAVDIFATVWDAVSFSRGLFGRARDPVYIEQLLRELSLWEKRTYGIT
jgi:ABC-2 type transport system ATP-binding protein